MRRSELERLFLRHREQGDVEALTRVFDRAAPQLLALASHLVREADQSEDLVQATFVTAIERAAVYDASLPLFPWLVGILNHKALLWNRRAGRRVDSTRLTERQGERDPALSAARVEVSRALRAAIERLPAIYGRVLLAYFEEGKPPREIARERGLAPGTVRARLHRGIDMLRRGLPSGLALGAGALFLQTRGLAAVREEVAQAARRAALTPTSLPAPTVKAWPWSGTMSSNVLTLSCVVGLVAGAAWTLDARAPTTSTSPGSSEPPVAPEQRVPAADSPIPREPAPVVPAPSPPPGPDLTRARTDEPWTPPGEGEQRLEQLARPVEPTQRAVERSPETLRPEPQSEELLTPPSSARIAGGRTRIGSSPREIEELLEARPSLRKNVRVLDAETPAHTTRVPDFHLMLTEVTNEQYLAFVQASGHRPPRSWADPRALDAARSAFLTAASEGGAAHAPTFDADAWWRASWRQTEWSVPAGQELQPVVFVDHSDARAYARWAGLRLPTEQEFQRAVRGDGEADYPWGADWIAGRAATAEHGGRRPSDVGTFPSGANPAGVLDLAGNVWEWTDSPYVGHEHFRQNRYAVGPVGHGRAREVLEREPRWDANQRVAVGGSFLHGREVARATVRRACDRTQKTNGLGLRCAATPRPVTDVSVAVELDVVAKSGARPDVAYAPRAAVGMDRWEGRPSTAPGAPPGYTVITDYDYVAFTPVEQLEHAQMSTLERESVREPVPVGFLTTDQRLVEPALEPGTYLVSFRAAGPAPADAEAPDPMIDTDVASLLLVDARTGMLAAVAEATAEFTKSPSGGELVFFDRAEWNALGEQRNEKWLMLDVRLQSRVRLRSLQLTARLRPEPELADRGWRR